MSEFSAIGKDGSDRAFTHVWYWRKFLGERKGQRCRIWARGSNGNLGLIFEDGFITIAPRYSVRRVRP